MTTYYVVLGEQGEYSDRRVWAAKVFRKEDEAKEWIRRCTAAIRSATAIWKAETDDGWDYNPTADKNWKGVLERWDPVGAKDAYDPGSSYQISHHYEQVEMP